MKEIIFNRKDYKSYKDFYTQIYKDLDEKSIPDWEDYQDLCYSADALNEFLWYYHNDSIKYIFVNFDKEKIALEKTMMIMNIISFLKFFIDLSKTTQTILLNLEWMMNN